VVAILNTALPVFQHHTIHNLHTIADSLKNALVQELVDGITNQDINVFFQTPIGSKSNFGFTLKQQCFNYDYLKRIVERRVKSYFISKSQSFLPTMPKNGSKSPHPRLMPCNSPALGVLLFLAIEPTCYLHQTQTMYCESSKRLIPSSF
jgi:hypothetical protein